MDPQNKSTVITAGGAAFGSAPMRTRSPPRSHSPQPSSNSQVVVTSGKTKKKKRSKTKGKKQQSSPTKKQASPAIKDTTNTAQNEPTMQQQHQHSFLEFEESVRRDSLDPMHPSDCDNANHHHGSASDLHQHHHQDRNIAKSRAIGLGDQKNAKSIEDLYPKEAPRPKTNDLIWLCLCFVGIMFSFVCYGVLLEYTTSGGRKLHELSFLFVTSGLYTVTAAAGRYVRDETPTTIPPARFAVLGLTSMGSTFCSVRSLRYVIYPIQVLAKSCKPVPVMLMGAFMGKRYPLSKYVNVAIIVTGVALFMGGGSKHSKKVSIASNSTAVPTEVGHEDDAGPSQWLGILLLFISLCFDGGTGAYEDKLMSVHSVQPFDLMYNIQLGKTILAGIGLLVLNQLHIFVQMCQEMGFLLVALGLSGALGQVFIFVTISKFGALTCSIIGLARKVTTLVASIYIYGHELNGVQFTGLAVCIGSMVMNFWKKKDKKKHPPKDPLPEEMEKMLEEEERAGDVELAPTTNTKHVLT